MRSRALHLPTVLMMVVLLVVVGCSREQQSAYPTNTELLEQRRAAGIADCPSAPRAESTPGGLPDLTLECLGTGSSVNLAGLSNDKPMLINFWAQWCGPCRRESPFLKAVHARWGRKVVFLGVDASDPQPEAAIEFAKEAGWGWPQVADPDFMTRATMGIPGLPHTIMVDTNGRIVHQHPGEITSEKELEEMIATHLGVG